MTTQVTRATFRASDSEDRLTVHFNPETLQYALSNTLSNPGQSGRSSQQYVSQSTAKLTMDLVFDSTDTGQDVQDATRKLSALMAPSEQTTGSGRNRQTKQVPKVVVFEWGNFTFTGMIESYKETLELFSANGVPLRASVNLGLARQDQAFADTRSEDSTTADVDGTVSFDNPAGTSPSDLAKNAGDPKGAKDIAAQNGEESLRKGSGRPMVVGGGGQQLNAAVGFSAAAGGGFGASASGGFGASASGGFGASASGSFSASGAVTGTAERFSQLHSTLPIPSGRLDPSRLVKGPSQTGETVSWSVGGRQLAGPSSADVGTNKPLSTRLRFEGS